MMMENPENVRIPERLREIAFWLRADEAWNQANWIDAAADEIERLRSLTMDWRKIESMDALPRDVPFLLGCAGYETYDLVWFEPHADGFIVGLDAALDGFEFADFSEATHWCPITPPEADT